MKNIDYKVFIQEHIFEMIIIIIYSGCIIFFAFKLSETFKFLIISINDDRSVKYTPLFSTGVSLIVFLISYITTSLFDVGKIIKEDITKVIQQIKIVMSLKIFLIKIIQDYNHFKKSVYSWNFIKEINIEDYNLKLNYKINGILTNNLKENLFLINDRIKLINYYNKWIHKLFFQDIRNFERTGNNSYLTNLCNSIFYVKIRNTLPEIEYYYELLKKDIKQILRES